MASAKPKGSNRNKKTQSGAAKNKTKAKLSRGKKASPPPAA